MEAIIKEEMRNLALRFYEKENLTYTQMANALVMDRRSYAAIACGEHKCGELTIVLMLIHMTDVAPFLHHLQLRFEKVFLEDISFV